MEFVWCRRPCSIATTSIFKSPLSVHFHVAANTHYAESLSLADNHRLKNGYSEEFAGFNEVFCYTADG
jgi:hypothetical protein